LRHEDLLRSLIWQFSQRYDDLPAALHRLYDQCSRAGIQPSLESLHSTLLLVLGSFGDAYVIVDALDECADRVKLLNWIREITRWKVGKLHLLLTSRQERDIDVKLQPLGPVSICLEGESVDLDIAMYLDRMLQDNDEPAAWNEDDHIRDRVKSSLLTGAQGMYDTTQTLFGGYVTD
jgi:hypothetical protein